MLDRLGQVEIVWAKIVTPLRDAVRLVDRQQAEVGAMQERFQWLKSSFLDLAKQETQKKVGEVMAPAHPLLQEDDTINKAIYVMFKENIRQPMVTSGDKIVGVVNLIDVFSVLIDVAGDECFLN